MSNSIIANQQIQKQGGNELQLFLNTKIRELERAQLNEVNDILFEEFQTFKKDVLDRIKKIYIKERNEFKELLNALHSIIRYSGEDWSKSIPRASLYGIILGWDFNSLNEFQFLWNLKPEQIEYNQRLHGLVKKYRQFFPMDPKKLRVNEGSPPFLDKKSRKFSRIKYSIKKSRSSANFGLEERFEYDSTEENPPNKESKDKSRHLLQISNNYLQNFIENKMLRKFLLKIKQ